MIDIFFSAVSTAREPIEAEEPAQHDISDGAPSSASTENGLAIELPTLLCSAPPAPPHLIASDRSNCTAAASSDRSEATRECPICQELIVTAPATTTGCDHKYHTTCLVRWRERCATQGLNFACCVCRQCLKSDSFEVESARHQTRSRATPRQWEGRPRAPDTHDATDDGLGTDRRSLLYNPVYPNRQMYEPHRPSTHLSRHSVTNFGLHTSSISYDHQAGLAPGAMHADWLMPTSPPWIGHGAGHVRHALYTGVDIEDYDEAMLLPSMTTSLTVTRARRTLPMTTRALWRLRRTSQGGTV